MLRFLHVVNSKRCYGSSTDQGELATVEHRFSAGHLQNTGRSESQRRKVGGTTNVSSCWFRLMLGEERERLQVSEGDT